LPVAKGCGTISKYDPQMARDCCDQFTKLLLVLVPLIPVLLFSTLLPLIHSFFSFLLSTTDKCFLRLILEKWVERQEKKQRITSDEGARERAKVGGYHLRVRHGKEEEQSSQDVPDQSRYVVRAKSKRQHPTTTEKISSLLPAIHHVTTPPRPTTKMTSSKIDCCRKGNRFRKLSSRSRLQGCSTPTVSSQCTTSRGGNRSPQPVCQVTGMTRRRSNAFRKVSRGWGRYILYVPLIGRLS